MDLAPFTEGKYQRIKWRYEITCTDSSEFVLNEIYLKLNSKIPGNHKPDGTVHEIWNPEKGKFHVRWSKEPLPFKHSYISNFEITRVELPALFEKIGSGSETFRLVVHSSKYKKSKFNNFGFKRY